MFLKQGPQEDQANNWTADQENKDSLDAQPSYQKIGQLDTDDGNGKANAGDDGQCRADQLPGSGLGRQS